MPWHVGKKGTYGCSGYPVVKDSDGSVVGCHKTKAMANAQVAALYANERGRLPAMERGAVGSTSLPLSERDATWDAGAAKKALDPGQYRRAFFYLDPEGDPKTLAAYKLPFARPTGGGGLEAVWAGVTAAANACQGGRGGLKNVSEGDMAAIRSKIAAYYRKAAVKYKDKEIKVPWSMSKSRTAIAQRRMMSVEIRATPDGVEGRFAARVINYNVWDDYNTAFAPGVFTESLQTRLPRITWAHDWSKLLGQVIAYDDKPDGLDVVGQLDSFDAVPLARQAYAQMQSGTIDQFSVGFMPLAYERDSENDRMMFTRARLDEVALVLAGAVPDTKLLALRSRARIHVRSDAVLTLPAAEAILLQFHSGDLDLADALQAVKQQAVAVETIDDEPEDEDDDADHDGDDSEGDGSPDPAGTSEGTEGEGQEQTTPEAPPPPNGPPDGGNAGGEDLAALFTEADAALAVVDHLRPY